MPRRRSAATGGGGRRLQLWTERHAVVVAAAKEKDEAVISAQAPLSPTPPPLIHARAHGHGGARRLAQRSNAVPSWLAAAMPQLIITVHCGTAHGAEDWAPSARGAAPHATGLCSVRPSRRCCARPSLSLPNRNGTMSRQPTPPHTHAHAHAPSITQRRAPAREGVWQCLGDCAEAAGCALSRHEVLGCAPRCGVQSAFSACGRPSSAKPRSLRRFRRRSRPRRSRRAPTDRSRCLRAAAEHRRTAVALQLCEGPRRRRRGGESPAGPRGGLQGRARDAGARPAPAPSAADVGRGEPM
jgi:hypothetical protein